MSPGNTVARMLAIGFILSAKACDLLHKIKMRGTLETVKSTFITSHEIQSL